MKKFTNTIVVNEIVNAVQAEVFRAMNKHDSMNSAHEAKAVIEEELDEFWDEVKQRIPNRDNLREELIQIAAMAVRAIHDLELYA